MKSEQSRNCLKCECHEIVGTNGGWNFIGCYCEPYSGKWVCEIKDCPKELRDKK